MIRLRSWLVSCALMALCIVLVPDRGIAQSLAAITGTVVDQSGGALVGAAVTVVSSSGATRGRATTDGSGMFEVRNVAAGKYRVQVERQLFNQATVDVEVVDGAVPTPLRVVLSVSGISEVVDIEAAGAVSRATTATKTQAPLFDTPVAVTLVPRALLDEQKAASLKDALLNVSSVQATVPGSAGNQFIIRGFSSGGVVMRDSLNAVTAAGFRTDFDDYNVDRVEVLKGPASVLFGRTQPGGIINVVTASAQAKPTMSVEQRLGSFDQRRTVVHATGPIDSNKTLLVRVDAVYEDSNSFRDYAVQGRKGINPRVSWRPSAGTELTVSYERIRMDYKFDGGLIGIGGAPADLPVNRALFLDPAKPTDYFNQAYTSTDFSHRFGKHWTVRHRYLHSYRDSTDVELNALSAATPLKADGRTMPRSIFSQVSDTALHSMNLELLGDVSTGFIRHQTLVGFDFLRDFTNYSAAGLFNTTATTNPVLDIDVFAPSYALTSDLFSQTLDFALNGVHNYSVFWNKNRGLYVQDQMTLPGRVHVLVGGRYDWANTARGNGASIAAASDAWQSVIRHDEKFSPRAGVVYQPTKWLGAYTSYSRSFGTNNGVSATGEVFPPQIGTQVEGGLKTEWFRGNLSSTLAIFQLKQTNLLIANLATADPTDVILAGDRRSKGVEFDLLGRLTDSLSANISYAYTPKAWVQGDNPPSLGGVAGNSLANVAKQRGSIWVSYAAKVGMPQPLRFGVGAIFAGKRFADIQNTITLPGYGRLDASAGYTFTPGGSKVSVSVNLRNLFNATYWEYAGGRTSIYPGTPRAVLVTASIGR
ncbi:MAG: TonB-dependent receptor [Vicinamibacterales bacterium]